MYLDDMDCESMMDKDNCNSKYLKEQLLHHLVWRLHYIAAVDEFDFMDVFGIRRSGYTVEYEIKVSKSDLDRELKLIKGGEQPKRWTKDWIKWEKHAHYLHKNIDDTDKPEYIKLLPDNKYFMPNEYYFYLPDYLSEYATKQLQGYPYGVINIGKTKAEHFDGSYHYYFYNYTMIKKAVKLHQDKVTTSTMYEIMRSLTVRNKLLH